VNAHNEWDPLEEIVVGRLDDATFPSSHPVATCNVPPWAGRLLELIGGFNHQAVRLPDGIAAHATRRPTITLGQVRDPREAAVASIDPRVIAASQGSRPPRPPMLSGT
jgi:hypothetical protein